MVATHKQWFASEEQVGLGDYARTREVGDGKSGAGTWCHVIAMTGDLLTSLQQLGRDSFEVWLGESGKGKGDGRGAGVVSVQPPGASGQMKHCVTDRVGSPCPSPWPISATLAVAGAASNAGFRGWRQA